MAKDVNKDEEKCDNLGRRKSTKNRKEDEWIVPYSYILPQNLNPFEWADTYFNRINILNTGCLWQKNTLVQITFKDYTSWIKVHI